uniref:Epidermal growth factor n=1 Tax=Suberites domuncula TaxID=55567 RepID=Q5W4Z0_SUBDO|nr:epidermal growth factor precursor [Suberites domuncula]
MVQTWILQLMICLSALVTLTKPQTTTEAAAGQQNDIEMGTDQLPPYILITTFNSIFRINPWPYASSSGPLERLVHEEFGGIEGVGYHYRMGQIFWTNIDDQVIRVANLDGSNVTDLVTDRLGFPADLSVDWINDKLYWTDRSFRRIEEYDLTTGYRRTVIHTGSGSLPTGIIIYPYPGYGWIYWTDIATETIERVSVTGDGREVIAGGLGRGCIRPLVLDYFAQTVYWIDNCDFSIRSVNISGNQVTSNEPIKRPPNRDSSLGVALYEDIIYWSETANVYGVNKSTGAPVTRVHAGSSSNPFKSLKVVHPNNQPSGDTFVEKILATVNSNDYNVSCLGSCVNGQCIPPGLCACSQGWSGVDCTTDQNECEVLNGMCENSCVNTNGSYYCTCTEQGYKIDTDGRNCTNIDECEESNGRCDHYCVNFPGSYSCSCLNRYSLAPNGLQCIYNSSSSTVMPAYTTSQSATTEYRSALPTGSATTRPSETAILTHSTSIRHLEISKSTFGLEPSQTSVMHTSTRLDVSASAFSHSSSFIPILPRFILDTQSSSIINTGTTTSLQISILSSSIRIPTSSKQSSIIVTPTSTRKASSTESRISTETTSSQYVMSSITVSVTPKPPTHPTDITVVYPLSGISLVVLVSGSVAGGTCLIIVLVISIVVIFGCYMRHSHKGSYTFDRECQSVRSSIKQKHHSSADSRTSFGINNKHSNSPTSDT